MTISIRLSLGMLLAVSTLAAMLPGNASAQTTLPASSGSSASTSESGSGNLTVACSTAPCPEPGSAAASMRTGRTHALPAPPTPEELKRRDQERRYVTVFGDLELYERKAKEADAAGNAEMAAAWRGHFAKMSGLTQEQVEIVKKIGQEYKQQSDIRQQAYFSAVLAARSAPHTERPSPRNTPAIAEAMDSVRSLFPETISKLVSALGSRTFSQLDGYTLHMHDNSRVLGKNSGGSASSQPQHPDSNALGGRQ